MKPHIEAVVLVSVTKTNEKLAAEVRAMTEEILAKGSVEQQLSEAHAEIARLKEVLEVRTNSWMNTCETLEQREGQLKDLKERLEQINEMRLENLDVARKQLEENIALKTRILELFDALKHGDDVHQSWLKEKIEAHFEAYFKG